MHSPYTYAQPASSKLNDTEEDNKTNRSDAFNKKNNAVSLGNSLMQNNSSSSSGGKYPGGVLRRVEENGVK